jgi:hypothetical protein
VSVETELYFGTGEIGEWGCGAGGVTGQVLIVQHQELSSVVATEWVVEEISDPGLNPLQMLSVHISLPARE